MFFFQLITLISENLRQLQGMLQSRKVSTTSTQLSLLTATSTQTNSKQLCSIREKVNGTHLKKTKLWLNLMGLNHQVKKRIYCSTREWMRWAISILFIDVNNYHLNMRLNLPAKSMYSCLVDSIILISLLALFLASRSC